MKTRLFLILMVSAYATFGQDLITYRNGEEVLANVIEVTSAAVKFKRAENPDGPTYTILKTDLFKIKQV